MSAFGRGPVFSILIANYNGGKYIQRALEGAINQTYKNIEIIVVDDGSVDDSIKIIESLNAENIFVYKNKMNYGCGYTKKRCVDLSSGDICGFLDADDCLASDAVENMVRLHLERVDAAIVYSNYYECDKNLKVIKVHSSKNRNSKNSHLEDHRISHFATFKKSKYKETPGINPKYRRAVDQDLYYKLEEVGEIHHYDCSLYYYRGHSESISRGGDYSLIASRYWHLEAIRDAFHRRGLGAEGMEAEFVYLVERLLKQKAMHRRFIKMVRRWLI